MIEIFHTSRNGAPSGHPSAFLVRDGVLIGASAESTSGGVRYGDIHAGVIRSVDRTRGFGFVMLAGGKEAMLDMPRNGTKRPEGSKLLVQVQREARDQKLVRVAERAMLVGHRVSVALAGPIDNVAIEWPGDAGIDASAASEATTLKAAAEKIRQRAVQAIGPQLLWPGRGCVADLLFRFPDSRPDAVLCDSRAAADSIGKVLATDPVGEGIAVEFVPDRDWRFSHAAMAEMLADALERRHALPSGATMLIERCETLTAIDINTGSASSVAGPERVAIEVNKAAAGAIGRLVRLLNLSGNVVIDFVGLRSKTKQRELVDRLRSAFASDPAQPWIGGMSPIGLVEMSRRYLGPDLFERFGARRADRGEGA